MIHSPADILSKFFGSSEPLLKVAALGAFTGLLSRGASRGDIQTLVGNLRNMRRGAILRHTTDTRSPITSRELLSPILAQGKDMGTGGRPAQLMAGTRMTAPEFSSLGSQVRQQLSGMDVSPNQERRILATSPFGSQYRPELGQIYFGMGNAAVPLSSDRRRPYNIYNRLSDVKGQLGGMRTDAKGALVFGSTGLTNAGQTARLSLNRSVVGVPGGEYESFLSDNPQMAQNVVPQPIANRFLGKRLRQGTERFETAFEPIQQRLGNALTTRGDSAQE